MLGRLLRDTGHTVTSVCDGAELLEIFSLSSPSQQVKPNDAFNAASGGSSSRSLTYAGSFDVVLVDRYMPKLEGPTAVR